MRWFCCDVWKQGMEMGWCSFDGLKREMGYTMVY